MQKSSYKYIQSSKSQIDAPFDRRFTEHFTNLEVPSSRCSWPWFGHKLIHSSIFWASRARIYTHSGSVTSTCRETTSLVSGCWPARILTWQPCKPPRDDMWLLNTFMNASHSNATTFFANFHCSLCYVQVCQLLRESLESCECVSTNTEASVQVLKPRLVK